MVHWEVFIELRLSPSSLSGVKEWFPMLHREVFIELAFFIPSLSRVKDWFPMLHREIFIELSLFHTLTLWGLRLVPNAAWGNLY